METESLQELKITIASEELTLLSEKAIYMQEHNILIVSDLHFGKIEHFRKNGIGLPANAARKDIAKLSRLIGRVGPGKVVF